MQLRLIESVYLIFIWFVLTLSLALKVLPYCCLVIDSDTEEICIKSQILSAFWDQPSTGNMV